MKKTKIILFIFIMSIIFTLFVYLKLPETIPTHWNAVGEIDGYSSKNMVFLLMLMGPAMYYAFPLLKKIDPKAKNYDKFDGVYEVFRVAISLFMVAIHVITLLAALGWVDVVGLAVPVMVGILFIVLGNYMGKIRQTFFVGIKTPWTLSNEVVWNKTHRLGGYFFISYGILFIVTAFIASEILFIINMIYMIVSIAYLFLYSYLEFKKIEKESE